MRAACSRRTARARTWWGDWLWRRHWEAAGEVALECALVGPKGCSLGTVVQLYWNSGTVSSSPVKNLYMSEVSNFVHNCFSSGVKRSKVFVSLIKRCCAIFINGSHKPSAMPVFNLVSTLLI